MKKKRLTLKLRAIPPTLDELVNELRTEAEAAGIALATVPDEPARYRPCDLPETGNQTVVGYGVTTGDGCLVTPPSGKPIFGSYRAADRFLRAIDRRDWGVVVLYAERVVPHDRPLKSRPEAP